MLLFIALYTISKVNNIPTPIPISTKTITLHYSIQFHEVIAIRNPIASATTAPTITNIAILSMVFFPMDILIISSVENYSATVGCEKMCCNFWSIYTCKRVSLTKISCQVSAFH